MIKKKIQFQKIYKASEFAFFLHSDGKLVLSDNLLVNNFNGIAMWQYGSNPVVNDMREGGAFIKNTGISQKNI